MIMPHTLIRASDLCLSAWRAVALCNKSSANLRAKLLLYKPNNLPL